uniref:Uncharacterized protein n=2 Tax=Chlamydia pneumoniae TaxID=83558 RepID=A0A0F7XMD8_CHLPN|nr:Uncharacterized protein BN1224_H12_EU_00010 [Chlamydia pneumoniae]CRI51992.1 Uncharacterized protein BN1224_UZG1_B_01410 [Chlamydia pneumoniae]
MYQLLSIGYSFVSFIALLWMLCYSPNYVTDLYRISLSAEESLGGIRAFPQAESLLGGACALNFPDLEERLPDLRKELLFLGSNDRPDACGGKFSLQLASSKECYIAALKERVYLNVTNSSRGPVYSFSPKGVPTELWIECFSVSVDGRVEVKVRLQGLHKELISKPRDCETLFLNPPANKLDCWEIAGFRVDASFPVKQKIRRIGVDKFLLMHGGAEYADKATKERVDFVSSDEENYSRYLAVGDVLLWDGNCWQTCGEFQGASSRAPLFEVKRIDDKVMIADLWNVGGTQRQTISLVKGVPSPIEINEVIREIEFTGMRSWSKPIVLVGGQRLILSPDDWILRTAKGWEKLSRADQIQDYVTGKVTGPLLVFEKLEKDLRGFVLRGHMFNAQRTLVETISLPLKQGFEPAVASQEVSSNTRSAAAHPGATNRGGS